MKIKAMVVSLTVFAMGLSGLLYQYASGTITAKNPGVAGTESDIVFGDPDHAVFFNYQKYLSQEKTTRETPESWSLLTMHERQRKVSEGEAFLKKLHADLLAKEKLSAEETKLIRAVWGKSDATVDQGGTHHSAVAGEKSIGRAEKVDQVSKSLQSFLKANNWGQLFDGGQNLSKVSSAIDVAGGFNDRESTLMKTSPKTQIIRPVNEAKIPPTGKSDNAPVNRTLPLAVVGAALLAGVYLVKSGKLSSAAGNVFSPKDINLKEPLGTVGQSPRGDVFKNIVEVRSAGDGSKPVLLAECDTCCTCSTCSTCCTCATCETKCNTCDTCLTSCPPK